MPLRLFYCDHHEIQLPPGHRFPMRKYRLLRDALEGDGRLLLARARMAEREEIELVHDPDYVKQFLKGMLDPSEMRRIGFPWSESLVRRTLASVGGTVDAALAALEDGFGGNLAGGTHHAFAGHGSGFCVFNDTAIAVRRLQREGRVRRAAIVDLDVHQGDGTAHIFQNDADVFTLSLHAANNFPFRKGTSRIDLPLPDAAGDEEYLRILEEILPAVFDFCPDIIFFQSGVDGLAGDALGRLALTHSGLQARDRMVMKACRNCGIPLATTLGGGYSDPIEKTVEAHANTFLTAAEIFSGRPAAAP